MIIVESIIVGLQNKFNRKYEKYNVKGIKKTKDKLENITTTKAKEYLIKIDFM